MICHEQKTKNATVVIVGYKETSTTPEAGRPLLEKYNTQRITHVGKYKTCHAHRFIHAYIREPIITVWYGMV